MARTAATRAAAAAFAARQLAATLHDRLRAAGLSCLRLRVLAELADGTRLERIWRTREALDESATADRVRWQLDGWLTSGGAGAITSLILDPLETAAPESAGALWRSDGSTGDDARARRVISRVQSSLGTDAVLQPRLVGGRGVAERIDFVPYGEQRDAPATGSWPGRIPGPLPARLGGGPTHPAARVRLIDARAEDVTVTAEALLSSLPYALGWGRHRYRVAAWAGPWPVDGAWWGTDPQRVARLQDLEPPEREGVPVRGHHQPPGDPLPEDPLHRPRHGGRPLAGAEDPQVAGLPEVEAPAADLQLPPPATNDAAHGRFGVDGHERRPPDPGGVPAQGGRRLHGTSAAATMLAIAPRRWLMFLPPDGCTRLVRIPTKSPSSGQTQSEVPVNPVWPYPPPSNSPRGEA